MRSDERLRDDIVIREPDCATLTLGFSGVERALNSIDACA